MPNATVRASATALPDDIRLRRRLADAAERLIEALDALDEPEMDREDGHDREFDPAESGVADYDGYIEQHVGEPSLGATIDLDQRKAWHAGQGFLTIDAEA